jgi:hypothetical protein
MTGKQYFVCRFQEFGNMTRVMRLGFDVPMASSQHWMVATSQDNM